MPRIKPLTITDQAPSLQPAPVPVPPIFPEPDKKLNLIEREPVQVANGLTALVAALSVLLKPWFNITDEQQLAIVTVIAIIGPIVAGIYSRSRVTPLAKLQ